jgi:hypothetical protein
MKCICYTWIDNDAYVGDFYKRSTNDVGRRFGELQKIVKKEGKHSRIFFSSTWGLNTIINVEQIIKLEKEFHIHFIYLLIYYLT